MHEGAKVVYSGASPDGPNPGTRGHVLSCTALYGHVQWLDGPMKGQVGLYPAEDLATLSAPPSTPPSSLTASLDDSLDFGSLVSVASASEAYDTAGPEGLLSHLIDGGHLASYTPMAQEFLQQLVAGLQSDPLLLQVTSCMDPEEADIVLRKAASFLMTDSPAW